MRSVNEANSIIRGGGAFYRETKLSQVNSRILYFRLRLTRNYHCQESIILTQINNPAYTLDSAENNGAIENGSDIGECEH